jgi:PAS domain S-box-containing protein
MKPPIPLRRFLSLQFAAVAALPVIIITLLVGQFLMPQMRSNISIQQQALARAIAGQISAHLMGGERQLVALAALMKAEGPFPAHQLTALLDANCGGGELFETIYTTTRNERTIRSVGLTRLRRSKRADLLGLNLSGRGFLRQAHLGGGAVWSETFLSTVSSRMAIAVTVPLTDGVIVAEVTLDRLSEFISHPPVEAGLFTLVVDRRGRIVADSQCLRGGQSLNMASLPASRVADGAATSSSIFEMEGRRLLGTMVDIEALGWKILVAQPLQRALEPVQNAFTLIAIGLGLTMVIALGLAWNRADSLSRIFRFYAKQAQAISRGEYVLHWPPYKTAEFKDLGENLQSMAQTIRRREEQLLANEKRLKDLVANVPGIVYQFAASPGGETRGLFSSINQERVRDIFGLESGPEAFYNDFAACLPDEDRARFDRSVQNAIEKIASWEYEGRFVKPSGEEIWFSGCSMPHEVEGGVVYYGVFMDITQRKQLEESLRLTQFCFDKASIGIFQVGAGGRIVNANEHACHSLGYSREDLCRMKVFDIDTVFTPEMWQDHLATLRREKRLTIETWHRHRSGKTFPVQIVLNLVFFEGREFHVGFAQDISERKRWESELAASEHRYRDLFNEAPMMYVITDNRHDEPHIKNVNNLFGETLGYQREEVGGTPLARYYTDDSKKKLLGKDGFRVALSGGFVSAERDLLTRDNKIVHTLLHSLPDYDADGRVIGTRAMYLDITERKQALEQIQHLRNYLSNIINSMPSVLVGVDVDGQVTQWNTQAELATGRSFDEALSQPLASAYPGLLESMERIKEAIVDRKVIRSSKIARHLEGATRFEDITIFPIVGDGVAGAVIRVDDVTERVRLEEMMIQSEKMLSVGGLAAGMAHEINNPLAGILQNTDVLENRLLGDLPANREAAEAAGISMAALRRYLEMRRLPGMLQNIRASGNRAATIVRNMLSFARKSDRRFSSHDLAALLDQTVELAQTDYDMKTHYDFKQIQIVRDYDQTAPPVPCESSKLQQVFLNILKNGAEAMVERAMGARSPMFILRVKNDDGWVQVEIQDNGPGMDDRTSRRIFEPFFTTKPVGQGTGLGLSVSYFIIAEDHGGEMRMDRVDDGGSCFLIRLPKTGKTIQ